MSKRSAAKGGKVKAIVHILRRWRDNALAALILVGIVALIVGALLWPVLKFMAVCKWLFQ